MIHVHMCILGRVLPTEILQDTTSIAQVECTVLLPVRNRQLDAMITSGCYQVFMRRCAVSLLREHALGSVAGHFVL